jgi:hypothetical protein
MSRKSKSRNMDHECEQAYKHEHQDEAPLLMFACVYVCLHVLRCIYMRMRV